MFCIVGISTMLYSITPGISYKPKFDGKDRNCNNLFKTFNIGASSGVYLKMYRKWGGVSFFTLLSVLKGHCHEIFDPRFFTILPSGLVKAF